MNEIYTIYLENKKIGTSLLENADAPMGVVFGSIISCDTSFGYDFLKEYCQKRKIKLTFDYPENKLISTSTIDDLRIVNEKGIEITGMGNQICGTDEDEYEITIEGIPYPFYEEEFPHHVERYRKMI